MDAEGAIVRFMLRLYQGNFDSCCVSYKRF